MVLRLQRRPAFNQLAVYSSRRAKEVGSQADLEVRYRKIQVMPPIGKQRRYPNLTLTMTKAREPTCPRGRARVEWKLLTNLSIKSRKDATEKIDSYAMRRKIETFHKTLKTGCKTEESRLRTADRLVNLIAVNCVLSWRIFWLTMMSRTAPAAPGDVGFTRTERRLLDRLVLDREKDAQGSIETYVVKLARLGG